MTNNKKKVVLVIVEGGCEEVLLHDRLRTVFEQHSIRFHIQHGDILYDLKRKKQSIKSIVGNAVKEFMLKNKFASEDLLCVLHIIDMDGCFIAEDAIVINDTQQELTMYHPHHISVATEKQKQLIATRNVDRGNNIITMNLLDTILPSKINYRMYYFSRNLEHVLFNDPNPVKGAKFLEVEQFITQLGMPLEEFLTQSMPVLSAVDHASMYAESWELIAQNTASLEPSSNVALLFEYIDFQSSQQT